MILVILGGIIVFLCKHLRIPNIILLMLVKLWRGKVYHLMHKDSNYLIYWRKALIEDLEEKNAVLKKEVDRVEKILNMGDRHKIKKLP